MTILDDIFRVARRHPEHPAIISAGNAGSDHTVTYAELAARVGMHAQRLTGAGLRAGQRCGFVARQGIEFIETALAILHVGACMVPLPGDVPPALLADLLARCQLHHMWRAAEGELETFAKARPVDGADDAAFRAHDPAYIRFTSGTTSVRKGVLLGHTAITDRTAAANTALKIGADDRILWLLPMAHHFIVSIALYLRYGATILLPQTPLAESILDVATRYRATVTYASPHHYDLLSKFDGEGSLADVRLAISTTTGLTESVARSFGKRWDLPLCQALGIIEVGLPIMNIDGAVRKPTALGRPLPAYDVWLRGECGERVQPDGTPARVGELCIRGAGLFDAYLDPWIEAASVLGSDGFRTGDIGWADAEGDIHMLGRQRNRIDVAGMKFFAEEVERVLVDHPAVAATRVYGAAHERLGQVPVAEVVFRNSAARATVDDLRALCRKRLETFKIPREFRVLESLSTTLTGKIQRWSQE